MEDILKTIKERQSTRGGFDPERKITEDDLTQILEAARWAPTAHNMQNFELVVVDDKEILESIAKINSTVSEEFVRENYEQLSFSEEELRKKKVGLLGTLFPAAMRDPNKIGGQEKNEQWNSLQNRLIQTSSALLIVVYDPDRRAPASEGNFLGIVSLGCLLENMWLTAQALGIGFQVVSAISDNPVEAEVKRLLQIPVNLRIAYAVRLGYPVRTRKYLRIRRDMKDFTHRNRFNNEGFDTGTSTPLEDRK
jgi:nitroreductase